jgi:hypothetical protein
MPRWQSVALQRRAPLYAVLVRRASAHSAVATLAQWLRGSKVGLVYNHHGCLIDLFKQSADLE